MVLKHGPSNRAETPLGEIGEEHRVQSTVLAILFQRSPDEASANSMTP